MREVFAIGYNDFGGQNDGQENQEDDGRQYGKQYPAAKPQEVFGGGEDKDRSGRAAR